MPIPLVPLVRRSSVPLPYRLGCQLRQRLAPALLLGAAGLAAGLPALAADIDLDGGLTRRPAQLRVGVERVTLPGAEKMGLVGTSYLVELGRGWSVGPAVYGAISGRRGGLFTIGAELAWRQRLLGPFGIGAGFYAGGGGGGSAPVGGGLMLRPHADLTYELGGEGSGQHFGLSISQVRFANGDISSHQLGITWTAETDFDSVREDRIGSRVEHSGRSGVGFDRVQPVFGVYKPRGSSRRLSGGPLSSTIGFVGVRAESAFSRNLYAGIEAAGAASGGVAGYAEYLGTLGTEAPLWGDRVSVGARLALGMGGGGDVDTGGGLLAKASVYGIVRLAGNLGLTLEGGLTRAPQGHFNALHASTSIVWVLDDPTRLGAPQTTRTELVGGVERYPAARRNGTQRDLQAVTLSLNRFIGSPLPGGSSVYLTGQAHSALGGGAGGYSVGLFGLGVQQPLGAGWRAGAEALAGAAGGGGVATEGGFVVQPMAYLHRDITPGLGLRIGAGRIQGGQGPLKGTVVNASLAFSFGVLSHGGGP